MTLEEAQSIVEGTGEYVQFDNVYTEGDRMLCIDGVFSVEEIEAIAFLARAYSNEEAQVSAE